MRTRLMIAIKQNNDFKAQLEKEIENNLQLDLSVKVEGDESNNSLAITVSIKETKVNYIQLQIDLRDFKSSWVNQRQEGETLLQYAGRELAEAITLYAEQKGMDI